MRRHRYREERELFFFFKQKTAYEMVGSDWSSDVCSSDLRPRSAADARRAPHRAWASARDEIGRASCRERVLPTVEISVVAVSLKKKKKGKYLVECRWGGRQNERVGGWGV